MNSVKQPKISIIVLTYNHELFVTETLASVEEQDYANIEVIIGDDASKDKTVELIDAFVSTSRLEFKKIYFAENTGITNNFNACLEKCSGDFIFLLGGDDLFLPGKISAQVEYMLQNSEVDISYHNVEVFDSKSGKSLFYYNELFGFHSGKADILVKRGAFNCGVSVAVRNNRILPRCDERIKFASDWLWYIEILKTGQGRIDFIDGVWARYRRHDGNVTGRTKIQQQLDETLTSLEIIDEKFPDMIPIVRKARAERMIAFSVKYFSRGDFSAATKLFLKALHQHIWAPLTFLKLRVNRLFSAVRL